MLTVGSAHAVAPTDMRIGPPPSFTGAAISDLHGAEAPPCTSFACVRKHVGPLSKVRLAGEFGSFTGRIARWKSDSLAGFRPDVDWGGALPAAPVSWEQVERLDKGVNNSGRGAIIGGLVGGTLGALIAVSVASAASVVPELLGQKTNYAPAVIAGGAVGGLIGAALGGAIGSGSNRWDRVYQRP